jgi:hypothetical protein
MRLVTHGPEPDLIGARDAFAQAVCFGSIHYVKAQDFDLFGVVERLESLLLRFITTFMKIGIPVDSADPSHPSETLSTIKD